MHVNIKRQSVDLSGYPDLVVIYLGMRVNTLTGIKTLLGFGPRINHAVEQQPEGLLLHEQMIYSLFPPHVGMRQYWRDFESLEHWARSEPHRQWWKAFLWNSGGTGFWHETYFIRGGFEGIFTDLNDPIGFLKFAPAVEAKGAMFSARKRLRLPGESPLESPVPESSSAKS